MAGSDKKRIEVDAAPAIILVEPQLGENIGTAARAMANFALGDLRVVNPRDGWPSERARAAASGADFVIDAVQVFGSVAEAVSDLHHVFATTARSRDVVKPVYDERVNAQVDTAIAEKGEGDLETLFNSGDTWSVE